MRRPREDPQGSDEAHAAAGLVDRVRLGKLAGREQEERDPEEEEDGKEADRRLERAYEEERPRRKGVSRDAAAARSP